MGDRNNPIKFGPEWLRNLARERSAGSSASSNQSGAAASGTSSSGAAGASGGGATSSNMAAANTTNTSNTQPKVQLAKLRYGREEMLALYDRTSEAPSELKYIDLLYQPRGKPPFALNNTFEDEMRENLRGGPPIGGLIPGERFGMGRGSGRGHINIVEGRGRARMPSFIRQTFAGRGTSWHLGAPRMPGYSGGADDEPNLALRSWNSSSPGTPPVRSTGDPTEWTQNKMYRNKRPGSNTNWRQPTRDDGEEWRSSEASRSRPQQDKWERDWGERPTQDKPQSWNSNRRTWVGGDSQNDDNLPEWAVDSAEAGAGSFDSSGAFHGYSNDDTNLPKNQDSAYPLTRSHTQGSFVRSKTVEEGSDEWWASEKAKKLSPKRFDASDIKFKKPTASVSDASSSTKISTSRDENPLHKHEMSDTTGAAASAIETSDTCLEDAFNKKNVRFAESKTFDSLMRSDINLEEASDERGNFQSVMITPNNSLRQKHQNIVSSAINNSNRPPNRKGLLQILKNAAIESELTNQHSNREDKIVDIMDLPLENKEILTNLPAGSGSAIVNPPPSGMSSAVNSMAQISTTSMQHRISSPIQLNHGLSMNTKTNMSAPGIQGPGMQATGMQTTGMQPVGITNSALNASLGLPLGHSNNPMGQPLGIPLQGVPVPVLPNQGLTNPGMGAAGMQSGVGISGYQSSGGMPGMSASNVVNSSLFLGQNPNNASLQSPTDIPMPNHGGQTNMFHMHGLQHSGTPGAFGSSIYGNIMQQSAPNASNPASLSDQWYYEDPKKNIQGPFSSKEMYNWYRAGFFSPSLMVRRACDTLMRPLGTFGPMLPFAQMELMFPISGGYDPRNQGPHEAMLNSQQGLGLDAMNMSNLADANALESMQFGTVGLMRNPPYGQQQMDSLWSQPSPPDMMWMQQAMNTQRNDARVNNLPMFFWDQQPSAIASNSLLPEEIAKEMKTEDQILAQLRASQNANTPQTMHFISEPPAAPTPPSNKPEDSFTSNVSAAPNLKDLQKIMQEDSLQDMSATEMTLQTQEPLQINTATVTKDEQLPTELNNPNAQQQAQNKVTAEIKIPKQAKNDAEKSAKNKENNNTKNKSKKSKEEKKEESIEVKSKEEDVVKPEKRSEETSPTKNKKDEKPSRKDMEKEKKEWIKDGFTVVKGAEKSGSKDNKKKAEEVKIAEDAERKRREEEKLAAEEEKKKKQTEALKKQQEQQQQQQQRQASESISKKAPWSAVANQALQATSKDGLTLAEIQRLEREKKLEQMKEQQQMMQIIAQQQAAALAREQEMQAGLGWAKKKASANVQGQSLAEIQAEARMQAAAAAATAAAAAAVQVLEETPAAPPPPVNHVPWGNTHNGGGFWDTQPSPQAIKPQPSAMNVEQSKTKKKVSLILPARKETSPAAEFDIWCNTVLASWSAKIDVPTFVGFLKDIESPYEVKDYVKCYLGESKDTSDFARQFLERRSKLLRVGMVTPSDDLCSPAIAINPRALTGAEYQEGKGKKAKKNKMLKVDARILGFSVTASEDRINVGDIDTV